jgi:hypothetical protein
MRTTASTTKNTRISLQSPSAGRIPGSQPGVASVSMLESKGWPCRRPQNAAATAQAAGSEVIAAIALRVSEPRHRIRPFYRQSVTLC